MLEEKADFSTIRARLTDLLRNKRTQLPTLPVVAQNIIRISSDPTTSAKDLTAFINKDQAIANKILRMANSSYYGTGKKVDSILRAITLIGFDEVLGLAVGIGVLPSLKASHPIGRILDMRQLWLHSLACCFATRNCCNYLRENSRGADFNPTAERATFLPALLHDMGKIIFSLYFPAEYAWVLQEAFDNNTPLQQVEEEMLGIDHAQLAALLMEHWHFPDSLLEPVRFHHMPEQCRAEFRFDASLIVFANSLVREVGIGDSYNRQLYESASVCDELDLDGKAIQKLHSTMENQRAEIEQFLQFIS